MRMHFGKPDVQSNTKLFLFSRDMCKCFSLMYAGRREGRLYIYMFQFCQRIPFDQTRHRLERAQESENKGGCWRAERQRAALGCRVQPSPPRPALVRGLTALSSRTGPHHWLHNSMMHSQTVKSSCVTLKKPLWLGARSAHLHKDHGSATDGIQKGISQKTNSKSLTMTWHKIWSQNTKLTLTFTQLRLPLNSWTTQLLIIGNSVGGAGVYPYASTSHLDSCRDRPRAKLFDRTLNTLLPG